MSMICKNAAACSQPTTIHLQLAQIFNAKAGCAAQARPPIQKVAEGQHGRQHCFKYGAGAQLLVRRQLVLQMHFL